MYRAIIKHRFFTRSIRATISFLGLLVFLSGCISTPNGTESTPAAISTTVTETSIINRCDSTPQTADSDTNLPVSILFTSFYPPELAHDPTQDTYVGFYIMDQNWTVPRKLDDEGFYSPLASPLVSHDGKWIVYHRSSAMSENDELWIADADTLATHKLMDEPGNMFTMLSWLLDGRIIYKSFDNSGEQTVFGFSTIDPFTGKIAPLDFVSGEWPQASISRTGPFVSFNYQGTAVVYYADPEVFSNPGLVLDLRTGNSIPLHLEDNVQIPLLSLPYPPSSWSQDGLYFAVDGQAFYENQYNQSGRELYIVDVSGKAHKLTDFYNHPGEYGETGIGRWTNWSPDGQYIAFASTGGIHLYDIKNGNIIRLCYTPYIPQYDSVTWSSSGQFLVIRPLAPESNQSASDIPDNWVIVDVTTGETIILPDTNQLMPLYVWENQP